MRNSIRGRLFIAFIGLAIGPLLIMGAILGWRVFVVQRDQAIDRQRQVAADVSDHLTSFIGQRETEMRLFIDVQGLQTSSSGELQNTLFELLSYQESYEELALLDADGLEIGKVSRLEVITSSDFISRAGQAVYEFPKANNQTYYSPIEINATTGEPLITLALPLLNVRTGNVENVFVGTIRLNSVNDVIADISDADDNVYIVNEQNRVIAHSDPSVVLRASRFVVPSEDGLNSGLAGNDVVLAVDRITLGDQTFSVVAERPASDAVELAINTGYILAAVVTISLVVAGFLSFLVVQRIVRPIQRLATVAQAIQTGDLSQRAEVETRDELGQLAEAFNNMTDQLRSTVDSLEDRVSQRTKDLQTTLEVGRLATSIIDAEELLPRLVETIRDRFELYYAQIYLIDEASRYAYLRAGTGQVGQRLLSQKHRISLSEPNSIVARTVQSNQAVLVTDTTASQIHLPNPLLPDTRSEVAIPLAVGGTILGVLDMQATEAGTFNPDNVSVFEAMATQLAGVLQSNEAFEEARTAVERADAINRRLTRQNWEGYLGRVARGEKVGYLYDLESPKPLDRQARLASDETDSAKAVLPITLGGQPIGNILVSDEAGKEWSPEELALVQDVAQRVAQAVEQLRAFDETETRARELAIVAEVSLQAASTLDPQELLQSVVDLTKESFHLYHAHIYLLDEGGRNLSLAAGAGEVGRKMASEGRRISINHQHSLVARAARTSKGVISNNVADDPDFLPNPLLPDTKSEMAIPLIFRNKVFGVLDVQSNVPNRFTEADLQVQTTLAGQLAVALTNARQFEETQALQARFQAILDNASSALISMDAKQNITMFNRLAEQTFGYSANEIIGQPFTLLAPERLRPFYLAYLEDFSKSPTAAQMITAGDVELYGQRKNGDEFPIEVSISKLEIAGETVFTAVLNDITARKFAEEELRKRAVELQAVAEVSAAAATTLDQDALLRQVANLTRDRFNLYHAHIYLVNEKGDALVLAAGAGKVGEQMAAEKRSIPISREYSLVARAARLRQGVVANNVNLEPDFLPNPLLPDTRSEMATPIMLGDELLGVLDVQGNTINRFTPEDVRIKTALADQIAVALSNARAFQQVERARQETERIFASSIDLLGSANFDGYFVNLNTAWETTLGWSRAELMAKPYIEFVHPDDNERTQREANEQSAAGHTTLSFENRYLTKAGTYRWLSWNATPDLEAGLIHFVTRDVTEQKLAEEEIRLAREEAETLYKAGSLIGEAENYQAIVNAIVQYAIPDQVSSISISLNDSYVDPERGTIIADWRRDGSSLLGMVFEYKDYAFSEIIGRDQTFWSNNIQTDERIDNSAREQMQALGIVGLLYAPLAIGARVLGTVSLTTDKPYTFTESDVRVVQSLAEQAAVTIERLNLTQQTEKRAIELLVVTEVSAAASTALELEKLLQTFCDLTRDSFNLYHAHVYLLAESGDSLVLAGGAGDVGRMMVSAGHQISLFQEHSLVARAARTGKGVVSNNVTLEPDFLPNPLLPDTKSELSIPIISGTSLLGVFDVQADKIDRFTDEDVRIQATLASQLAVSITNARLYEEQLETTERLREVDKLKSEFLASMSHELRTPLNSIIGYAEVILDGLDGEITEEMEEDVAAIHGSGKLLLNLINDILDLAKIEAGQMALEYEEIDLIEFMQQMIDASQILVKDKPVQMQLKVDEANNIPKVIEADPIRLQQIVNNLLSNAAKFTEEGTITLNLSCENGDLTVAVEDTGMGIPEDKLDIIFERFRQADQSSTRRKGGTGLGLDITRRLVNMHGGSIWVQSEYGVGSTFAFKVPVAKPKEVAMVDDDSTFAN